MPHHHGRMHHLVPRQRHHTQDDDDEPNVVTIFRTLPNTYTVKVSYVTPGTLVGVPVQATTAASAKASSIAPASSPKPSSQNPSASAKGSSSDGDLLRPTSSPQHVASTLMVATAPPSSSGALAAATTVAAAAASSSASAAATGSSGMSGGAKAGLTFGILFGVGAILAAVLFVYHRKKQQMKGDKIDDEKNAMQSIPARPPPSDSSRSIRTERTMSTAPRLSLRPVTQFSPTWNTAPGGSGAMLSPAAATAASVASREPPSSPDRAMSAWERRGAANAAQSPTDPFSDPQPRASSPAENPFDNHAAVEPLHASFPEPPQTPNDSASLNEFANPAAAIAAAIAAADTASTVPAAQKGISPALGTGPAASPANAPWVEDVPASPGPAPTSPPPIAVAGGAVNGPMPAPGPNNVHRVQLDFRPSMDDELELRPGQLVRMLHEYDDGWALCVRMDRSQQGVAPRSCLSKHPVKPRTGPPRQGPPRRARGPPLPSPMGSAGVPRPLSPASGRNSPHPPTLSPANGRMSPAPRSMSPGPGTMSPPQGRARSNSSASHAGPPRSMSPGPQMQPSTQMGRPRSNSANQVMARRNSPPGPSPMNPNANALMPARKPLPGLAL